MRRREFVGICAAAQLAIWQHAAALKAGENIPKVGLLLGVRSENSEALMHGLAQAGYVDGRNIVLETRFRGMSLDLADELARELVALECRVIFAADPYAIGAVRRATTSIPIIGIDLETDPVASGWAQSLARPAGNLTGVFLDLPELGGKLIDFARDIVPSVSRLAGFWDATVGEGQFRATAAAAHTAGVGFESMPIRETEEIRAAFERAASQRCQCVILLSSPLFFSQRVQIADAALQTGLPIISLFTSIPKSGGLLAYGPNVPSMFMRAASYIGRIISGAKPGDLPIERPSKFELIINTRTANALGINVPQALLARADEVIE